MESNQIMEVKSATRVIDMLELFASKGRPMLISEIGNELKIPSSSCFKLVRTVERRGYLCDAGHGAGVYPTRRLLKLAKIISDKDALGEGVSAVIEKLRDETQETAILGRISDAQVLTVDAAESFSAIRFVVRVGDRRPLHANSVGKAILASMAAPAQEMLIKKIHWQRFTSATRMTEGALRKDLAEGAERGWWTNDGESVADAFAIACPVRIGEELYGISITGPSSRVRPRLHELATIVHKAAATLSRIGRSIS